MASDSVTVALISDVFIGPDETPRLIDSLKRARSLGAQLVVLPEIPLNSWCPAIETPNEGDAEAPGGPRHQALSDAARAAGLGVVGGAIVRDPQSGRRHNAALVFDGTGTLVASYRKVHLPDEKGFWETRHYDPGDDLPSVIPTFGMRIGLQLCSDVNRPEGSRLLAALDMTYEQFASSGLIHFGTSSRTARRTSSPICLACVFKREEHRGPVKRPLATGSEKEQSVSGRALADYSP